jgi:hypothetical protein
MPRVRAFSARCKRGCRSFLNAGRDAGVLSDRLVETPELRAIALRRLAARATYMLGCRREARRCIRLLLPCHFVQVWFCTRLVSITFIVT